MCIRDRDDALKDVENLATLSVSAMEQTTAKALREAVKGGKASREELVALGKQVFDEMCIRDSFKALSSAWLMSTASNC